MDFKCLLCESTGDYRLVSDTLRDVDSGRFKVVRCVRCGHTQLTPLPTAEEDEAFYMRDTQVRGIMSSVDLEVWRSKAVEDTARRINWVTPKLGSKVDAILDIGSGYGFFVDALSRIGYPVTGVEISEDRIQLARVYQGTFLQCHITEAFVKEHAKRFKVVTLFHVLEHLRNPVEFLKLCSELIAEGGFLLVEVPNLKDDLLNHSDPYRAFYWQRAHLSYFDPSSLELALLQAGFTHWRIAGVQRYGLRNLLHWLDQGKPQLQTPDYKASESALASLESLYRADREHALLSDTLIAEISL